MKTANTNADGKYPVALWRVTVYEPITNEQVEQLWPRAYGKSVAIAPPTRHREWTRFDVLIAHATQTTRADLVRALERIVTDFKVELLMSCAEIGFVVHTGSPRQGTKRALKNGQHGKAIAAQ